MCFEENIYSILMEGIENIIIWYGNVGREIFQVLEVHGHRIHAIVKSDGVYDSCGKEKIGGRNLLHELLNSQTRAFVSVPSFWPPDHRVSYAAYYEPVLRHWWSVITCEKSALAHCWDELKLHMPRVRYSATVWGNSGILPAITAHNTIHTIKAVINGTLNVISDESARGQTEEAIYNLVTTQGFAEPGAKSFADVIEAEIQDVLRKAVILANHSGLYSRTISMSDIVVLPYQWFGRCMLVADRAGVTVWFMDDDDPSWFPHGVDNALLINGKKVAEWPGAWARATALRMLADGQHLT